MKALLNSLVQRVQRLLNDRPARTPHKTAPGDAPAAPARYRPLTKLVLTSEVSQTLFEEYQAHRESDRGDEETGWVLLGLRDEDQAVAMATLPAGADRQAGQAHVRFNSDAQALASRVVRQSDRRMAMLGVVHTHPGTLRHPSDGDYRGDSQWVGQLRGGEGVFGIGTADAPRQPHDSPAASWSPQENVHCLGKSRLSWYALGEGDAAYRNLPVELCLGPDLARPLRPVWAAIEEHATRLDRLARQLARVRFGVAEGREKPALTVSVPLPDAGDELRAVIEGKEVRYYLLRGGNLLAADFPEARVDQGVFLLLAELAARG